MQTAVANILKTCECFQHNCDVVVDDLLWFKARKAVADPQKYLRRTQREQGRLAAEFRRALEKWYRLIDAEYARVLRHLHIVEKVVQGDILTRLMNWRYIEAEGKETLRNAELRIYQQGAEKAVQFAGLGAAFDVSSPWFGQVAEARAGALVTGITEGVRTNIHDTIAHALRTGQSIDRTSVLLRDGLQALPVSVNRINRELAERLAAGVPRARAEAWARREMTHMRNYRAHMIARTEGSAAMNEGALMSYEAAGVKKVEFIAQFDACPECEPYAGQIMPLEEAQGLIPIHSNCLCGWAAVIEPTVLTEDMAEELAEEGIVGPAAAAAAAAAALEPEES